MKHGDEINKPRALRAHWRRAALRVWCGALAMLLASGIGHAATYSYKISVAASFPTGTAGKTLASTQPVSTKLTPCSTAKIDAITFTVTYDAGNSVATLKDVYMILYNPDLGASPFYTFTRGALGSAPVLAARATPAALTAAKATDIYVKATENPGSGSITETVLGGYINVDGVTTGTWQMIAIIADNATVNFDDPTTWTAWDTATVIFGKPWKGAAGTACTSIVP
jgi:hypothetical protein